MQRSPVNCNDLIAELGNTWMEKLYNPESRMCFLGQGVRYCRMLTSSPVPPEDRGCSSFQACAFSPLWLHYQGTLFTCGMGRGVPFLSHKDADRTEAVLRGNCVRTNAWHWNGAWAPTAELLELSKVFQPKPQRSQSRLYKPSCNKASLYTHSNTLPCIMVISWQDRTMNVSGCSLKGVCMHTRVHMCGRMCTCKCFHCSVSLSTEPRDSDIGSLVSVGLYSWETGPNKRLDNLNFFFSPFPCPLPISLWPQGDC